ncbi:hypothetical protein tinsulaeT_10610 [Thalassotalea insulae]|uniref:Uncharacterized protein n=1 Tax=Thalassotalea insulae TaxID=2056778 RepID=A0ABQ6GU84_9GAMM|nr:hypothetical protein [Thalassotalea insulae]GLX77721.1 hypothetical protein tinsulaeT_10610 [Thalassotalea insulae]
MINRFKRGLTINDAALIASDLSKYSSSIKMVKDHLKRYKPIIDDAEAELNNPYNDEGITKGGTTREEINVYYDDCEKLQLAENIYEALIDEARIACQWYDYRSGEGGFYDTAPDIAPTNDTALEVFELFRYGPDYPEISFVPDLDKTMFTKVSIAKWFEAHLPEKSNIFDPSESYKTLKTGYSIGINTPSKINNLRTPESSLIDSLAIMAWLLSKKSNIFERGEKPNAKQIKEAIEKAVDALSISNDEENKILLSNLNKDISMALKQLEERLKL